MAEHLHMTVKRLRDEMPNNEFHQWRAFLMWKAAMREKAERESAVTTKLRGRRGR